MTNTSKLTLLLGRAFGAKPLVITCVRIVQGWGTRHRARHRLALLDDHMLKDIGLDRTSAQLESARPFWRD